MYTQDWIMRQIEMTGQMLAAMVFGQRAARSQAQGEIEHQAQTAELTAQLAELVARRQLCRAEDLLFDCLNRANRGLLAVAMDFYEALNALSDQELAQANFSRDEILSGQREVIAFYGLGSLFGENWG